MAQAVALLLGGITSLAALLIGTRALRLRRGDLRPALGRMLECVGSMVMFAAANVAIGVVAIVVGRALTGAFVSTYVVTDAALLGVSCLQGLVFHCWRHETSGRS